MAKAVLNPVQVEAEAALQEAILKPDLLAVSGSRLYGTNRPSSDNDFRGFVMPPYEFLTGLAEFKDRDVPGADHKVYSAKRFLELVLKGDPQLTELLYIPAEKIVVQTDLARELLALRPLVMSNAIYARIMGYGYSEWRKAMGVKLEVTERTKTEDDVINDIRNIFGPDKEVMDEIIELLMQNKEHKVVPSTKGLGEKRRLEFEQFGMGVTSAAHSIRLSQQLVEVMTTGVITFPRPNAKILLDIRLGKYSKEEVEQMYLENVELAKKARDESILQDKPQSGEVWSVYRTILKRFLRNDPRFNA